MADSYTVPPQSFQPVQQPAPGQAWPAQQVVVPQQTVAGQPPVVYVPVTPAQPVDEQAAHGPPKNEHIEPLLELRLINHSSLFYWWPVWAVGYLCALLTYVQGRHETIGNFQEWFAPNSSLGVVFFLTLFLVILITNVTVRGMASGMVILSLILVTVLLAYFGWWDTVLNWFGHLRIHMNLGAYLFFSTLIFGVWFLTVFIFDRMSYWLIKPGQITYVTVFGAGSKSYDTEGMVLEKYRGDVFRHWILGLGSGDLHIQTTGATRDRIDVPNVLFIGSKISTIQQMIAERPNEFGHATLK